MKVELLVEADPVGNEPGQFVVRCAAFPGEMALVAAPDAQEAIKRSKSAWALRMVQG